MTTTHRHGIVVRLAAVAALAVGALSVVAIRRALACETAPTADTFTEWQVAIDPTGIAAAPSADTFFTPASGQSFTYLVKNSKLYAIVNKTSPEVTNACGTFPAVTAGTFKWTGLVGGYRDLGSPMQNFASPVPVSSSRSGSGQWCHEAIFVTTDSGLLYKINAADGSLETPTVGANLKRTQSGGCAADKLIASPAVQLYDFSNSAFKDGVDSVSGHASDDLVFVITRYNASANPSSPCYGGDSRNRIYALWAKDLTVKWVFNAVGEYAMGYGSEGCSIDYENNTLYCGTNMPTGVAGTNSLWALDTVTGRLLWSDNAGPLVARPMVAKDASGSTKVFTASSASPSSMRKYQPDGDGFGGPIPDWQITLAGAVQRNVWPEPRGSSHSIFAVDTSGNLYRYTDLISTVVAVPGWPIHDTAFQGMPVFAPNLSKLFIGRSDGTLQQIDTGTAAKEGAVTVGTVGTSAIVGDAVLDVDGADVDRVLAVTTQGYVIRKDIGTFGVADNTACSGINLPCGPGPNGTAQGCVGYQARNPEYDPCNAAYFCDTNQLKCQMLTCQTTADCAAPATCLCPGGAAPPCASFTGTCIVPDGTPCDDNRACTFSFQCTDNSDCTGQGDASFTVCNCADGSAPPCAGNSGYCQAGSCDGGPYGTGNNCNNVCQAGRCSSTFFNACPCVNSGDAACSAEQTCCGSTVTSIACTADSQCGSGVCPSGNGSCQWVAAVNAFRCRCGICADLNTDSTHCGSCTTNCGPTDPNNPSVCEASQCDGSLCNTPSVGQIQLTTVGGNNIDADAMTFERNGLECSAYVSGYNPKVIRRVTSAGLSADATTIDAAFLSGVAVPKSGAEVFGCFINDGVPGLQIPGLAQGVIPGTLSKPGAGVETLGGGAPFIGPANTKLNHGPVGPALNYFTYTPSNKDLYFGNWNTNGDLVRVSFNGTAWLVTSVPAYSGIGRITALHFERRPKVVGQAAHSTLYVAHGTILSIVDIDVSPVPQIDIDLASPNVYTPGQSGYGDAMVTAIRSIAVHPKFGDIYVEVSDASNNSWIMNLDEPGHAGRHQLDVQKEINPCMRDTNRPPSCSGTPSGKLPSLFSDEGRIVMTPSYDLLRIGRDKSSGAVTYTEYKATGCNGADCNN